MSGSTYAMRPSRVLQKLKAGETAYCTKLNLADARAAEIAAMSGFDCIWTDMEHVPNDWSAVEKQILAGKVYGVDTIVRISRGSYSDYIRPLEMDAAGIMVPHIMSLADAKAVVRHTKFHPLGRRAVDGGNADGGFCTIGLKDYLEQANAERFNILQIEDAEALDELEAIIALPGLDMIFFGPGDFSQSIGAPGQMDHPLLLETRVRIAKLAGKHGKFAGTVGSAGNAEALVEMGYRFISVGADVVALSQYYRCLIDELRKQDSGRVKSIYSDIGSGEASL
ncbi:aldolase/citrate lyase family protein [Paenibacillus sp. J5C_2022]|uniref:HpcH/HpaI aldolase family protein n=1 Tax=Paenibacillus sp. J5C2022 TaxID=2977129 RepID=UPI0021D3D321|nr:aldolase/citrate lyase family protein [Paenibacillus sp. J5C2022]MCU6711848.1 aldolase/citrate lyase family protein [Paenibacillus sp. J5C2022]